MKAAVNGVPNLSVLDGWWPEGYDADVGWAIDGVSDEADRAQLYRLLETEVVPTWHERDAWLAMMNASIATPVAAVLDAARRDRVRRALLPARRERLARPLQPLSELLRPRGAVHDLVMERALPAGTVTFLFTDVEGSTQLLHSLGEERYAGRARRAPAHPARAPSVPAAASRSTRRATRSSSPSPPLPPRSPRLPRRPRSSRPGRSACAWALHSGTPLLTDEGYVGVDVHRAARIAACGHGGQILLSTAAAGLVDPVELHDLGEHRLKDLSAPERIYQFGGAEFPPLKSLYRTNLPVPATPFLGRARRARRARRPPARERATPADAHRAGRRRQDTPRAAGGGRGGRQLRGRRLLGAARAARRRAARPADRRAGARRRAGRRRGTSQTVRSCSCSTTSST